MFSSQNKYNGSTTTTDTLDTLHSTLYRNVSSDDMSKKSHLKLSILDLKLSSLKGAVKKK